MSEKNGSLDHNNNKEEPAKDAAAFERWLDNKLKNVYGSVLEEPIPQDILRLLQQKLDKK